MERRFMIVGFTGTQIGMSTYQKAAVRQLLINLKPEYAVHGDCVGADAQFHGICKSLGIKIVIYPPLDPKKRAFCEAFMIHPEDAYLERNKKIVNASDIMIATPKSEDEELRSGTWSTVRYTRKTGKKIYIIDPEN
jgi:hypothetical protein